MANFWFATACNRPRLRDPGPVRESSPNTGSILIARSRSRWIPWASRALRLMATVGPPPGRCHGAFQPRSIIPSTRHWARKSLKTSSLESPPIWPNRWWFKPLARSTAASRSQHVNGELRRRISGHQGRVQFCRRLWGFSRIGYCLTSCDSIKPIIFLQPLTTKPSRKGSCHDPSAIGARRVPRHRRIQRPCSSRRLSRNPRAVGRRFATSSTHVQAAASTPCWRGQVIRCLSAWAASGNGMPPFFACMTSQ